MCPPVFRELEGQTSGRACFRAVGWECPTPEGPLAHLLARLQAAVADPYTIEGEFGPSPIMLAIRVRLETQRGSARRTRET